MEKLQGACTRPLLKLLAFYDSRIYTTHSKDGHKIFNINRNRLKETEELSQPLIQIYISTRQYKCYIMSMNWINGVILRSISLGVKS
jgi:hypothetical protein